MINRIVLVGRLCNDPETRYTQNGVSVTNFTLAVERPYKSGDQKVTDFIPCVAWRKTGEIIAQYSGKGKTIGVDGFLQMRKYKTKEGDNRTIYEVNVEHVQLLDFGNKSAIEGEPQQSASPSDYTPPMQEESELPF